MIPMDKLAKHVQQHPYPMLFATISGAHLYGFPSADSDFDLRGTHLLPLSDVIGLFQTEDTIDKSWLEDGLEIDLVTHDAAKFFGLMLKKNGYVLEQVFSPLIVYATPEHDELKAIASDCITKHHWHHYKGFAQTQWKMVQQAETPLVKPLLYTYRVLMTGIHLMRYGKIEANLGVLNEEFGVPLVTELMMQKVEGQEKELLDTKDWEQHSRQVEALFSKLENEAQKSSLPEHPTARAALNDLLIRLRRRGQSSTC